MRRPEAARAQPGSDEGDGAAVYRFDDLEVDPAAFQARKSGAPLPLEPKAFEVLVHLAGSGGRLMSKAELQARVWPGTAVSEGTLTRLIAQLRRSLGDDAREARYIQTVPTRGYRFLARLEPAAGSRASPETGEGAAPAGTAPDPAPPPLEARRPGRRRFARAGLGFAGALAVVALVASLPRPAPAPERGGRTSGRILVSIARGFNAYPAFSPDGSAVAYTSDQTGALEIWVRPLAPGSREVQVTRDGQHDLQPAWSPDGRHIAFASARRGGVWVAPALGGVPRQLTRFGSRPVWSPAGDTIAFLSSDAVALDAPGSVTSRIWLVSAAGGDPRPLTERGDPPGGHRSASFSPDGRRLSFLAGSAVWLVDLATGRRRPVDALGAGPMGLPREGRPPSPGALVAGEAVWSPDGRFLVGVGRRAYETVLWRSDVESGRLEESPALLTTEPTQSLKHVAVSPDGRRLAYALVTFDTDLHTLPLGPDGAPAGPPRPLLPRLASRKQVPLFSPDGRRLSFGLWQPGEGSLTWTSSADGTGPAPAGTRPAFGAASWSPEGRLVVLAKDEGGHRLVERDPGSGRERVLRDLPPAAWARLSPDGREVAFMCGGDRLFTVCAAGLERGEPRRLVESGSGAGWPVWSPDGRTLAVELFDGEDTQVGLVPRAGGEPRRLTRQPGQSWPHSWTPDGRRVVFAGQRAGVWNVYWVDVRTGEERRLTDYDRPTRHARYPTWSPTGDQVVYEYGDLSGNVWVAPLSW